MLLFPLPFHLRQISIHSLPPGVLLSLLLLPLFVGCVEFLFIICNRDPFVFYSLHLLVLRPEFFYTSFYLPTNCLSPLLFFDVPQFGRNQGLELPICLFISQESKHPIGTSSLHLISLSFICVRVTPPISFSKENLHSLGVLCFAGMPLDANSTHWAHFNPLFQMFYFIWLVGD